MNLTIARVVRTTCSALCALLVASVASADPSVETLRAADGHPLTITYYPVKETANSGRREESPVVVLLHGSDKGRILWDKARPAGNEKFNFAQTLNDDGYAVITVDLRKFGDSKAPGDMSTVRPDDWEKMALFDMVAVKEFIFAKHQERQLNMNKLAIIAAGPTAPVAINFAAADWTAPPHDDAPVLANKTPRGQDVRALVLLSPETTSGRLTTNRALNVIKAPLFGVGMLVVAGNQDALDKGQSKKIFDVMEKAQKKDQQRVYQVSPPLKDRELNLIGRNPNQVEVPIREFLNKHVRDFPSAWRDRKSKVTG